MRSRQIDGRHIKRLSAIKSLAICLFIVAVVCNPFLIELLFSPDHHLDFLWKYIVIVSFEIALSIISYCMFFRPRWYLWTIGHYRELILLGASIIISLFLLEAILKLNYHITNYGTLNSSANKLYGWDNNANVNATYTFRDMDGSARTVHYQTFDYGYREIPDAYSDEHDIRILVLGDSFTQAEQVSNNETYYSYLEDIPNVSVFAKGVKGWGTAQEYVFLKTHIDEIRPDIVIVEFCSNDFINNDYDLTTHSIRFHHSFVAPFMENGTLKYENDGRNNFKFSKEGNRRWRQYIYAELLFFITPYHRTIDYTLEHDPESLVSFNNSVESTEELFMMIKNESRGAKVFSFGICFKDINSSMYYTRVMSEAGIEIIPGVEDGVGEYEEKEIVWTRDGHWNPRGHEIVGEIISDRIRQYIETGR